MPIGLNKVVDACSLFDTVESVFQAEIAEKLLPICMTVAGLFIGVWLIRLVLRLVKGVATSK